MSAYKYNNCLQLQKCSKLGWAEAGQPHFVAVLAMDHATIQLPIFRNKRHTHHIIQLDNQYMEWVATEYDHVCRT